MADYSKWDHLDLSDDDDVSDCHPNIDEKLWRRIQNEKKQGEWDKEDQRHAQLLVDRKAAEVHKEELTSKLAAAGEAGEGVAEAAGTLEKFCSNMAMREKEIAKLEFDHKWRSTNAAVIQEPEGEKSAEALALEKVEGIEKMELDARIEEAVARKEAGTVAFKAKNWQEAYDG